jgi:hypothetical protein
MALLDEYTNPEGYNIQLFVRAGTGRYSVMCWTPEGELSWEVDGVVTEDTGTRIKRRPYADEAEARIEFERWRR